MRTLRILFGLISIILAIVLPLMFFVPFFLTLASGGAYTPSYPLDPQLFLIPIPLLVAGIVATAGSRNKIGAIVAGLFYIIAGGVGIFLSRIFIDSATQAFTTLSIVLLIIAAFFILGGIFQKGMRMKSQAENRLAYQYQQAQMQAALHPVTPVQPVQPAQPIAPTPAPGWLCACGTSNEKEAKFCKSCGKQNPATETWTCDCGQVNAKETKFCARCGKAKPEAPIAL